MFATQPMAYWADALDRAGMCWAPAQTVSEMIEDPRARASGAFVPTHGAEGGRHGREPGGFLRYFPRAGVDGARVRPAHRREPPPSSATTGTASLSCAIPARSFELWHESRPAAPRFRGRHSCWRI